MQLKKRNVLVFSVVAISALCAVFFQNCSAPFQAMQLDMSSSQSFQLQSLAALPEGSQYSPFVISQPGWAHRLMLYCRNSPEKQFGSEPVWRDRVWRALEHEGQWQNPQVVIQSDSRAGEAAADDLSCSPGAFMDGAVMHAYYVTASREADMDLYLYHAESSDNGASFSAKGVTQIAGVALPVKTGRGYLETPTPVVVGNKVYLYYMFYSGEGPYSQSLYRSEINSQDKKKLSQPQKMQTQSGAMPSHGRVSYIPSLALYVYTYSEGVNSSLLPTTLWLEVSEDGIDFSKTPRMQIAASGSEYLFSPMPFAMDNGDIEVFHARSPLNSQGHFSSGTSLESLKVSRQQLESMKNFGKTPESIVKYFWVISAAGSCSAKGVWKVDDFGICQGQKGQWLLGEWGSCARTGQACGAIGSGQQNRNVVCQAGAGVQSRNVSCVPAQGQQTRSVVCQNNQGMTVADSFCQGGAKPAEVIACSASCDEFSKPTAMQSCSLGCEGTRPSSAQSCVATCKSCHYAGGTGSSTVPGKTGLCQFPAASLDHGQRGTVSALVGSGSITGFCNDGEWDYSYSCSPQ